jgi:hypothetical protein
MRRGGTTPPAGSDFNIACSREKKVKRVGAMPARSRQDVAEDATRDVEKDFVLGRSVGSTRARRDRRHLPTLALADRLPSAGSSIHAALAHELIV